MGRRNFKFFLSILMESKQSTWRAKRKWLPTCTWFIHTTPLQNIKFTSANALKLIVWFLCCAVDHQKTENHGSIRRHIFSTMSWGFPKWCKMWSNRVVNPREKFLHRVQSLASVNTQAQCDYCQMKLQQSLSSTLALKTLSSKCKGISKCKK